MSGAPKPTAVLRLQKGKLYSDQRDRAELEPQPKRDVRPRCPKAFTADERASWRNYAATLDIYGLFQGGNAGILKRVAIAAVVYEQLHKTFTETGDMRVGMAMLRVGRDMDAMEVALGLPSMARAKLGSLSLRALKEKEKFFDD